MNIDNVQPKLFLQVSAVEEVSGLGVLHPLPFEILLRMMSFLKDDVWTFASLSKRCFIITKQTCCDSIKEKEELVKFIGNLKFALGVYTYTDEYEEIQTRLDELIAKVNLHFQGEILFLKDLMVDVQQNLLDLLSEAFHFTLPRPGVQFLNLSTAQTLQTSEYKKMPIGFREFFNLLSHRMKLNIKRIETVNDDFAFKDLHNVVTEYLAFNKIPQALDTIKKMKCLLDKAEATDWSLWSLTNNDYYTEAVTNTIVVQALSLNSLEKAKETANQFLIASSADLISAVVNCYLMPCNGSELMNPSLSKEKLKNEGQNKLVQDIEFTLSVKDQDPTTIQSPSHPHILFLGSVGWVHQDIAKALTWRRALDNPKAPDYDLLVHGHYKFIFKTALYSGQTNKLIKAILTIDDLKERLALLSAFCVLCTELGFHSTAEKIAVQIENIHN